MLDHRHPKSIGHYQKSNGVIFTPYPTSHQSVGIIGVDREVQGELSNQGSWRRMINIQQRQPTPTLKVSPNFWSSSSKTTFLSVDTFLRMFSFSKVSWFFSLRNLSLSKDGAKVEDDVLWALVFLTIMLKSKKNRQKTKTKEKTKGRLHQTQLEKKIKTKQSI